MKRIFNMILVLLVLPSIMLTGFAANDTLTVTNAKAEPGDEVYLTLMLNEKTVGNSMGVSTAYDDSILEPLPASSSWESSGTLQDFNSKGAGVWAIKSAKDLMGTVCVLAFRVKENVAFTDTSVECTLIVKNDGNHIGTYTATALVSYDCDHTYGNWEDAGKLSHSRSCTNCNAVQVESHSWDEGKISAKPGDPKTNLMTYTCQICGSTNVTEFAANEETQPAVPTVPVVTQPVATQPSLPTAPTELLTPVTRPVEETTRPTEHVHLPTSPTTIIHSGTTENQNDKDDGHNHSGTPTVATPYQDYNQPNPDEEDHSGHVHEMPTEPPMAVPYQTGAAEVTVTEGHVHTEDAQIQEPVQRTISIGSVCAVLGALVAVVATAVYFAKKKH